MQRGLSLNCTNESWGGFPFHFEFDCTSPILTLKDRAEARSGHLLLVALAYYPWQIVALLDGPTTFSGQGLLPTMARHGRVIANLTLEQKGNFRISAELPKPEIDNLGLADQIMFHTRPGAQGGTDIAISITRADYHPEGRPPLRADDAELLGTLSNDLIYKVDKVSISQDTVRYWGDGTLSLDAGHRVTGKLLTETNDLEGLLHIIEPQLNLTDQQKKNIRMVLGLLGNATKIPVAAQDGQLFVGPFKIADLPPLY